MQIDNDQRFHIEWFWSPVDSVNIFEAALLTMQAIHNYARVRCRQAIVRKFDARLQVDKGQGAADGAQDVV